MQYTTLKVKIIEKLIIYFKTHFHQMSQLDYTLSEVSELIPKEN